MLDVSTWYFGGWWFIFFSFWWKKIAFRAILPTKTWITITYKNSNIRRPHYWTFRL